MDQWKLVDWIDGYPGMLEVSNTGRVRRKAYTYDAVQGRWGTPMRVSKPDIEYSPVLSRHGYPEIAIQVAGKRRKFFVHRLVGRAFVPGYHPDLFINHINGVKTDNRAENLEWVTLARNTEHQWETGLVDLRGDKHPTRKLSSGKVRIIRDLLRIGATCNQLSVLLDISPETIRGIKDGRRWMSVE